MTTMTHDKAHHLEKRASFFRAVSAVTPVINEELDERTRHIIREELAKMGPAPQHPKKPSVKAKIAMLLPFLDSFSDEMAKIANLVPNAGAGTGSNAGTASTVSSSKSLIPKNTLNGVPKYTQVNPSSMGSPAQQHQPMLGPPAVRG